MPRMRELRQSLALNQVPDGPGRRDSPHGRRRSDADSRHMRSVVISLHHDRAPLEERQRLVDLGQARVQLGLVAPHAGALHHKRQGLRRRRLPRGSATVQCAALVTAM